MRKLILLLLLAGCSSNNPQPLFPSPTLGKWQVWGTSTGQTALFGDTIMFPAQPKSNNYVYTVPGNLKTSITLNYSVDGTGTFWVADSSDTQPATLHLFLWQKGDNLSCQGDFANYRMFAGRTVLAFGTNQITVPLDPAQWTGCLGKSVDQSRWTTFLANPFAMGFTFGGNWFAGHGVGMASGSATFKVNSYTAN